MHPQKKIDNKNAATVGTYVKKIYEDLGIKVIRTIKFKTAEDQELQLNGVDLIIQEGNSLINIDEKARVDYANNDRIPGFAFEITSINKDGIRRVAWLYEDTCDTDRYHIITNIIAKIEHKILTEVSGCTIRSIDRKELQEGIETKLNKQKIRFYSNAIVDIIEDTNNDKVGRLKQIAGVTNVELKENLLIRVDIEELGCHGRFVYTIRKKEKPLNLYLTFDFLENYCGAKKIHS